MSENKKTSWTPDGFMSWLFIIAVVLGLIFVFIWMSSSSRMLNWDEFESQIIARDGVKRIVIENSEVARIYTTDSLAADPTLPESFRAFAREKRGPQFSLQIGSPEVFEQKITVAQKKYGIGKIPIDYVQRKGPEPPCHSRCSNR